MIDLMGMMNPETMKKMQQTLSEAEQKLRAIHVTGESGGGIVKVTLNGQYECLKIEIDPIAVDPRDVPMLETLVQGAYSAAWEKVKTEISENSLHSIFNGLPDFLKNM